jgi:hypothetical protein
MTILDTTSHGRRVRILQSDDQDVPPEYTIVMNGRVYPGFTSRVDAVAAARTLVRS